MMNNDRLVVSVIGRKQLFAPTPIRAGANINGLRYSPRDRCATGFRRVVPKVRYQAT
jgi:hypothetical protein